MQIVYTLTDDQIQDLHQLYQQEWWTEKRLLEETRACVQGSQICIGIVDENKKLIGFARVLTDYTFKALIFDVIVCESSKGLKLGHRLMELIRGHRELSNVKHFELYCLPEMFEFYRRYGFSEDVGDIKLMRCINDN